MIAWNRAKVFSVIASLGACLYLFCPDAWSGTLEIDRSCRNIGLGIGTTDLDVLRSTAADLVEVELASKYEATPHTIMSVDRMPGLMDSWEVILVSAQPSEGFAGAFKDRVLFLVRVHTIASLGHTPTIETVTYEQVSQVLEHSR